MRTPFASTKRTSGIPLRRMRRIDDTAVGTLERADLRHLRLAQRKIEQCEFGGEMLWIARRRDRNDALLHVITKRELRATLAVRLADAFAHAIARCLD